MAIYLLVMVTSAANTDIVKLCEDGLRDPGSKSQCKGLLNITKDVYWAISLVILSVEACEFTSGVSYDRGILTDKIPIRLCTHRNTISQ